MDPLDRFLLDPEPLTPEMLGLTTPTALADRIVAYMELVGMGADATEAQRQRVLALIYGARIVVLEADVERFRAEGQITVERSLLPRIARLAAARDSSLLLASALDGGGSGHTDVGPLIEPWGVSW